jgi:5-methylcytosine-specific restriction endonuclease McrA
LTGARSTKRADPFYGSTAWVKLRSRVRARWRRDGSPPCPLCKKAITGVPIVDHIIPRRKRPDLALEGSNMQVVCHPCNTQKGVWEDREDRGPEIGADGFPVGGGWS